MAVLSSWIIVSSSPPKTLFNVPPMKFLPDEIWAWNPHLPFPSTGSWWGAFWSVQAILGQITISEQFGDHPAYKSLFFILQGRVNVGLIKAFLSQQYVYDCLIPWKTFCIWSGFSLSHNFRHGVLNQIFSRGRDLLFEQSSQDEAICHANWPGMPAPEKMEVKSASVCLPKAPS